MPLSRLSAYQQQTEVRPLQVPATGEVSAWLSWSVPSGSQRPLKLENASSNGCLPRPLEMRAKSEGHVFRSCSASLTQALPQLSVSAISSVCHLCVFPAFPDHPACCGFLQHCPTDKLLCLVLVLLTLPKKDRAYSLVFVPGHSSGTCHVVHTGPQLTSEYWD